MYKSKFAVLAVAISMSLAACGGGGGSNTAPVNKIQKISTYGAPVSPTSAVASTKFAVAHADVASGASAAAPDVAVVSLSDALAAKGVTATVSAQTIDGTALHAIIMGENNGLPPTPDQFKTDPSEWMVANFVLDDMVSTVDVPAQQAALAQFQSDLTIFIQRAHVSGKEVFIVVPIPTCDAPAAFSAAEGLQNAIATASATAGGFRTGAIGGAYAPDANGVNRLVVLQGHLGDDCRTPDATAYNIRTDVVATDMADRFALAQAGK